MAKTLQEKIAVMQAAAEGKTIQWTNKTGSVAGVWGLCDFVPDFDWIHYEYRVKKEPRVIYINIYTDGAHCGYNEPGIAKCSALPRCSELAVKFVEVIE